MFGLRRRWRRRLRETPLPEAWWAIIDRNIPLVRRMNEADRAEQCAQPVVDQLVLDEVEEPVTPSVSLVHLL